MEKTVQRLKDPYSSILTYDTEYLYLSFGTRRDLNHKLLKMKEFLKRFGIIFIVLGVIVVGVSEFSNKESNGLLLLSGALILVGFVLYIIMNRILD